jgi:N-acetylneuraminic acid mutarotase
MIATARASSGPVSRYRSCERTGLVLSTALVAACGGGGSSSGPAPTFTVEASINGLTAPGLFLSLNGSASAVPASSASFAFSSSLTNGSNYSVAVSQQPTGELCTVSKGSGTINGASVTVDVACGSAYTIGGAIAGLLGSGLVLANGNDTLAVSASATSFVLPTAVGTGMAYSVVAQAQPPAQSCAISNGNGAVGSAAVTDVNVSCAVWVWSGGSNTPVTAGVYGTQGVASASNVPGARGGAASWLDANGVLWLFGGDGYDAFGMHGIHLNDLWSFNPKTRLWTWIGGSTRQGAAGVYGTQGTPAAGNTPGARQFASSWITPSGDLWLFGGSGLDSIGTPGELNDLWKFSPSTGLWTWITGSKSNGAAGTYGTKGIGAAGNSPGGRDSAVTWVDSSGNLWLFGGEGITSPGLNGDLNDLWKFDTSTLEWTWVAGSSTGNQDGIYGTMGTAAVGNAPGSRYGASAWLDHQGRFWLFGGNGLDSSAAANLMTPNVLNDTWMFDPSISLWTWVAGSNTSQAIGNYVAGGMRGGSPGARQSAAAWIDPSGVAWIFGGIGRDSVGATGGLNDLWKLENPNTGWIWVSGSKTANATDNYGTEGTRAVANSPGARSAVVAWSDGSGNLWLYGGFGVVTTPSYYSDIWAFAYP